MQTYTACFWSEIGPFEIVGTHQGILTIKFNTDQLVTDNTLPACMTKCLRQLEDYFKG